MATIKNPVIGTAPCDHIGCTETVTVHEVKRGGSSHRGQLYTRCPGCGCDQTSGKRRQQWLLDNTTPRAEFSELFEFKKQNSENAVSDDSNNQTDESEKPEKADDSAVSDKKSSGIAVGIIGLIAVSGLALLGLKK